MNATNLQSSRMTLEEILVSYYHKFIDFIPILFKAILIFVVGLFLVKSAIKIIKNRFVAQKVNLSVGGFLISVIQFILYVLLILTVSQFLGFETKAIYGALTGLVFAIGLALQGSLSNFAGGVLILIFRPFEVGDFIKNDSGTEGTVEKIDLLYTTLRTTSGIAVFSPNGALANSVMHNFTKITNRRFEYTIGISYSSNIKIAKETILKIFEHEEKVLNEPKPEVFVKELADSSVNLTIRAWTLKENYWDVFYQLQEQIKVALESEGISIPFPQREMRIISDTKSS